MNRVKYQTYTTQLYNCCSNLITDVSLNKKQFKNIYETSNKIIFEDTNQRTAQISTCEMVLKHDNVSIYYRDNIIQFCANSISYIHDVIYIPNNQDFSFHTIGSEGDLFQLSTIIDTKLIKLEDIIGLNNIKEYFEYRFLSNNT